MNTHDKNSSSTPRDNRDSTIRADPASKDVSSGKSGTAREPQTGTSIDNRSNKDGGARDLSRGSSPSQR